MWPWIKRWRDWAMHDLWRMHRSSPQPQALHYSYEKAGLTINDQPIPWNADAVVVEVSLRITNPAARRKADFQLRIPGQDPITAENLRPMDGTPPGMEDRFRLFFRVPPPRQTVSAEVFWKNHSQGQLALPVLGMDEFIQRLGLQMPTLSVRLGNESVACQTFVCTQCKGLIATALVTSPTSLAPILDLGLHVEFRSERSSAVQKIPAQLCSSQLRGRQALVTVVPPRFPKHIGSWLATWVLNGHPLATQRIRAISKKHFQRSLRVSDSHFLIETVKGMVSLVRQLPPLEEVKRAVPCFLISSREPGMAGVCRLQVRAVMAPGAAPPASPALEEDLLVSDGPTRFAPGSLSATDLAQVTGFELRLKSSTLGTLSLAPAPTASFTNEGGFKPAGDFSWSPTAEEELNERLCRLLEERTTSR
jgi:hypothetical protein